MDTNLGSKIYKQFDAMLNNKTEDVEEKIGGLLARTMPKNKSGGKSSENEVNKRVANYMMQIRSRRESLKNGRS